MKLSCCFWCKDEEESQGEDTGERTHLLRDPVTNSTPVERVQRSDSKNIGSPNEVSSTRGQENELDRIVQETASAMIDISGSASHSLDHREVQERSRHYYQKVQQLSSVLINPVNNLLGDIPNPDKHLASPFISQEDIDLVDWAMEEIQDALHSIRVEHTEELVVPFGNQPVPAEVSD